MWIFLKLKASIEFEVRGALFIFGPYCKVSKICAGMSNIFVVLFEFQLPTPLDYGLGPVFGNGPTIYNSLLSLTKKT